VRHLKKGRKFNRTSAHRQAMLRNMATSLFRHEKIETTYAKAMELRGYAEKLITRAKEPSLHNKRIVMKDISDREVHVKLFSEIAPKFISRPGGYTRVVRTRIRTGDASSMAVIELVQE
jgi:large subunit ribosomal protein L17